MSDDHIGHPDQPSPRPGRRHTADRRQNEAISRAIVAAIAFVESAYGAGSPEAQDVLRDLQRRLRAVRSTREADQHERMTPAADTDGGRATAQ